MRLLKTKSWFRREAAIMTLLMVMPFVFALLAAAILPWLLHHFR